MLVTPTQQYSNVVGFLLIFPHPQKMLIEANDVMHLKLKQLILANASLVSIMIKELAPHAHA
jgi:hypothetical protein